MLDQMLLYILQDDEQCSGSISAQKSSAKCAKYRRSQKLGYRAPHIPWQHIRAFKSFNKRLIAGAQHLTGDPDGHYTAKLPGRLLRLGAWFQRENQHTFEVRHPPVRNAGVPTAAGPQSVLVSWLPIRTLALPGNRGDSFAGITLLIVLQMRC